jgi:hypothetical protein
VGDVVDPENQSIYRQLSGGVTAAHILHGSANPIGGQSILIKHRWGHNAEELKIENQVGFLKHALGENVKRMAGRYPNTRMGVDQIIRDAYQRAVDYNNKWKAWNAMKPADRIGKIPPRRDLELDAIVDVLEKRSFIECHTYVQSEGTMIMQLAKDADLVLWTDHPLSIYARASKTMVDGVIYFDEEIDAKLKQEIDSERNRIISNILRETSAQPAAGAANASGRPNLPNMPGL